MGGGGMPVPPSLLRLMGIVPYYCGPKIRKPPSPQFVNNLWMPPMPPSWLVMLLTMHWMFKYAHLKSLHCGWFNWKLTNFCYTQTKKCWNVRWKTVNLCLQFNWFQTLPTKSLPIYDIESRRKWIIENSTNPKNSPLIKYSQFLFYFHESLIKYLAHG